jgi:hypothetical protein
MLPATSNRRAARLILAGMGYGSEEPICGNFRSSTSASHESVESRRARALAPYRPVPSPVDVEVPISSMRLSD